MFLIEYFPFFFHHANISIIVMENFHDFTMMILSMIITFILIIMSSIIKSKHFNYNFKENMNLEILWTILPMFLLMLIAYPSLFYLYLFDLAMSPSVYKKVFGVQWYWVYENFNEKMGNSYNSYMLSDLEILSQKKYFTGWRLLETDTRLIVPFLTEIQCLTTSMDVIHSFSIPDLAIKMDAVPGRLNSVNFQILKPGVFHGQCSEICGTGHSFMPICLEAIN